MRQFNIQLALAICSGVLSGCGAQVSKDSSSDSADAVAGGFISSESFQFSDKVTGIDETQAADLIASLGFFYFKKNKDEAKTLALADGADPACQTKQDTSEVSEDGKMLSLSYVYDDEKCPEVQDKYINKMKIFISIACSDTSLASYAGKTVRTYIYTEGAKEFCGTDKTQKTFINAQYQRISADESATTYGGMMKSDGSACSATFENGTYKMNDCLFLQRTDVTATGSTDVKTSKLIRLQAKDLTTTGTGRFYASGKTDMQINNWKGAMTYAADYMVPTYNLEFDTKKVKGSLTAGIYE